MGGAYLLAIPVTILEQRTVQGAFPATAWANMTARSATALEMPPYLENQKCFPQDRFDLSA
jgi:hypothetical protein